MLLLANYLLLKLNDLNDMYAFSASLEAHTLTGASLAQASRKRKYCGPFACFFAVLRYNGIVLRQHGASWRLL